MCPLVASPNRGYADWQRVDNWDSGLLISQQVVNSTASAGSPVTDVSRYGYLAGLLECSAGAYVATFVWYADAAGTVQIGARVFVITSGIPNSAQVRIPNMGPFVVVTLSNYGGGPYSAITLLFGTNRYHPCEFIPVNALAGISLGGSVPAGGNVTQNPSEYFSGPAHVHGTLGPNTSAIINAQINPPQNVPIFTASTTGILTLEADVIIPGGAWYFQATNTGASATNVFITVIPSLTGSV